MRTVTCDACGKDATPKSYPSRIFHRFASSTKAKVQDGREVAFEIRIEAALAPGAGTNTPELDLCPACIHALMIQAVSEEPLK